MRLIIDSCFPPPHNPCFSQTCSRGTLKQGAPIENRLGGAGSTDVKIKWSALSFDISLERGALFHSEMGLERGAAIEK